MRTKRSMAMIFLLVALAISIAMTPTWAATQYQCVETELPDNFDDAFGSFPMVQKDGGLDAYWCDFDESWSHVVGEPFEKATPHFMHSDDGGKTWTAQSTAWLDQCVAQYVKDIYSFYPEMEFNFCTDGNNQFYFLGPVDHWSPDPENEEIKYNIITLFKLSKGTATPLRTFKETASMQRIELVNCNGNVLLRFRQPRERKHVDRNGYMLIDSDNGEILQQGTLPLLMDMEMMGYAGGKIYGSNVARSHNVDQAGLYEESYGRSIDKRLLMAYDLKQQKETLCVEIPYVSVSNKAGPLESMGLMADGTFYCCNREGIYRIGPNEKAFTQVMDASAAHFTDPAASTGSIMDGFYGDFYIVTRYGGVSGQKVRLRLFHYIPEEKRKGDTI